MEGLATPQQVTLFLTLFKEHAQYHFTFVEREKSLDSIARLGITIPQVKQEIMGLTYKQYCRGPLKDSRKGGELWEFGTNIQGHEVFIRLKVALKPKIAKCQSFHIAERPLRFPY